MRTQPAEIMAKPVCMKNTREAAKRRKNVLMELSVSVLATSNVLDMHCSSASVVGVVIPSIDEAVRSDRQV